MDTKQEGQELKMNDFAAPPMFFARLIAGRAAAYTETGDGGSRTAYCDGQSAVLQPAGTPPSGLTRKGKRGVLT